MYESQKLSEVVTKLHLMVRKVAAVFAFNSQISKAHAKYLVTLVIETKFRSLIYK